MWGTSNCATTSQNLVLQLQRVRVLEGLEISSLEFLF